jgi:hypothetical protein
MCVCVCVYVQPIKFKKRRPMFDLGYSATKCIINATNYSTEQGNSRPPPNALIE